MSRRAQEPDRLDVAALAAEAGELSGRWPLVDLPRLAADEPTGSDVSGREVQWSVTGERRIGAGSEAQTWLHLHAHAEVLRECQRCLQPVALALEVDRPLRFVQGEERAAALDAELDEDVLPLEPRLDLRELVEDELILVLPIVPCHEVCPEPLPLPEAEEESVAENPFAVLAGLRRRGPEH